MTSRGANSDSFEMNPDIDFGPLVSLLLNSLLLNMDVQVMHASHLFNTNNSMPPS